MRRKGILLVLLLLASVSGVGLVGCGGDGEDRAQPFESPEGRFRVDFPGRPQRQEQTETSTGTPIKIILFTVDSGNTAYSVAFSDLPETANATPNQVLDAVPDGSATRVPGKVRSKSMSTFVGSPAIDYVIEGEGEQRGALVNAKAVLVGRRLYIIQAASKNATTPFFARMLASFQLLPG